MPLQNHRTRNLRHATKKIEVKSFESPKRTQFKSFEAPIIQKDIEITTKWKND